MDAKFTALYNTTCVKCMVTMRRGHTAEVVAYGDTLAAHQLSTVKKHDYVLCFGQRKKKESFKKKIQDMTWDTEVRPSIVIVAKQIGLLSQLWEVHEKIDIGIPRFLMALWNLPEIQKQAREQSLFDERPDEWESGDG